jgi:hypothetical protein
LIIFSVLFSFCLICLAEMRIKMIFDDVQ